MLTFAIQDWNMIGCETCFCLNANEQRWSATCCDTLAWEILWLECQRECSFLKIRFWLKIDLINSNSFTNQLNDDLFDQLSERAGWLLQVQMMNELSDDFCVGFTLELISALLEELLDVLIVRYDAIMNNDERVLDVGSLRMRVEVAWASVRCPTRMRNAAVRHERAVDVEAQHLFRNRIFQDLHLAGLLDQQNSLRVLGVDGNASRVIAAIFQSLQSGDEILENLAASLRRQVIQICKNTWNEPRREGK